MDPIRKRNGVIKIHYDVDLIFYDLIVFGLAPSIHTFITAAEKCRTIRHESRVRLDADTTDRTFSIENNKTKCGIAITCSLRHFAEVFVPHAKQRYRF